MHVHTITLHDKDCSLILSALSELPYRMSANTITRLRDQIKASMEKAAEAKDAPADQTGEPGA